MMRHPLQQDRI